MNDRELLEMAAKAAGIHIDKSPYNGGGIGNTGFDMAGNAVLDWHNYKTWNPLTDDGDAMRLAVEIYLFDGSLFELFKQFRLEEVRKDSSRTDFEITRRAIVRAAAEIGKGVMK